MNYFIKSLWFGAVFKPQCWLCALKRNPVMPLLFAAVLFFALGYTCDIPDYLVSARWLIWSWLLGMVLFISIPRGRYKLVNDGKTLYVFIYDTYSKWKIAVDNPNRSGIVRVFEQEDGKWRKSGANIVIRGFDDSLAESSGFLLIRCPYSSWQLLGNGYNNDSSLFVLGHKIADYAFVFTRKKQHRPKLNLLHGRKVAEETVISYEKYDYVTMDDDHTSYAEAEHTLLQLPPACIISEEKGVFLLVKDKDTFKLFKLINGAQGASAYRVYTEWFTFKKKDNQRTFCKDNKRGYVLVKNLSD